MQRDLDTIREILLFLENSTECTVVDENTPAFSSDWPKYMYHIDLIIEAGFIKAELYLGESFGFERLTWGGHDYLDAVRDPAIWRKTKEGISSIGSLTFDLVKQVAVGFVKQEITKATGIPLP